MSVPLSKRTLSKLEYYDNAIRLRISITNLLLRDFGVKDKIRNVQTLSGMRGMSKEDIDTLNFIADKYNIKHPVLEKYPSWLIDYFRSNILDLLKKLIQYIVAAKSIHVNFEHEYYERRRYQISAIIVCEQLSQEFQYIIEVLPCDLNKFIPYIEMIENEKEYLKLWRKSDNKLLSKFSK